LIKFSSSLRIRPGGGLDVSARRVRLVHQALDSQILRDTEQYVPMDKGNLTRSVSHASSVGRLVWAAPYAKYQYYGKSRKGNPLNYRRDGAPHPKARAKWLEASKRIWMLHWTRICLALLTGRNPGGTRA
jgi:hypothetical protein